MNSKIVSFFYENAIPFNVAAASSFALMIDESIKFAKQNPLQSYKVPHRLKLPGKFEATMHMSQQKNLSLLSLQLLKNMEQQSHFAVLLKQQNGGSNSRRRQAQDVCLGNEDVSILGRTSLHLSIAPCQHRL